MSLSIDFSSVNKQSRDGVDGLSICGYKKLIVSNGDFPSYSENAAYSARKVGEHSESAALYMQAYLADSNNLHCLKQAAKVRNRNFGGEGLVLVLIPAFNAEKTIVDSVKSVLDQSYKYLKVVVIDDASTDRTYELLVDLQNEDDRLCVIRNACNKGAFYSVNIGLFVFRWLGFDFFLKHDADDLMLQRKIGTQVERLESNKSAYFCTAGYERVDFYSGRVISGKSRGHNMTLYRADVFRRLGYFDVNRFGCDSEYLERAIAAYGREAEVYVNEKLTSAYRVESGLVASNPLGSIARQEYQLAYRSQHSAMKASGFYFRDFCCRKKLLETIRRERPVICGVATLFSRINSLRDTVFSILSQVDKLIVYQNDYKEIPDFLCDEKIEVISAIDTGIDMGDAGKFYRIRDFGDVNYFSIDDDLIYPPDYVDTLLDVLAGHDYRVIVSAHGRVSMPRVNSYYKDKLKVYHFGSEVSRLSPVHFGGTGVMAFSTNRVHIAFDDFKHQNMADVWMGLHAMSRAIPIFVVPHSSNWICHSDKFDINETIFRATANSNAMMAKTKEVTDNLVGKVDFSFIYSSSARGNEIKCSRIFEAVDKSIFVSCHCDIVVAIPTFNRKEFLVNLVRQIDVASEFFNVHVVIFDDGSDIPIRPDMFDLMNVSSIKVHRYSNHGKKNYWSLVNKIFDVISVMKADYCFYLADDLEVSKNFFFDSCFQWEMIKDDKKISLNLLRDARTKSWTNFERVECDFSGFKVFKTQWLDMVMMFDHRLLSHRLNEIPLSRWDNKPLLSSGVGAQLSSRFHSMGYSMYQVTSSLVFHGDHDSKMNPEERKINRLIAI